MKSSTNVKAIDVVKQMVADGQVSQEVAEKYFPELKESEDEKIRKEIVRFIVTTPKEGNNHKKWIAWLEKQGEQKPWSEEDEKKISDILAILRGGENCHYNTHELFDWFKSIIDRVQPKQEWNEEDRKIIIELIGIFESSVDGGHVTFPYRLVEDYIRVLKSCIPQKRWQPTEKQMYNLSEAAHYNCAFFDMEILKGLYDDLKQL